LKDYDQYGVDVHPPADVSLNGVADDGRAGEGDDVAGIERYIGYIAGTHVLTDGAEDWQVWANLSSSGEVSTVRALGGNDRVVGQDGAEDIDGGAGDDYLEGGKGHDTLTGGPGKDVIFGDETDGSCNALYVETCVRFGNDVIQAADGEVDQIDCGPGADRAVVDAGDVVAANCELVERATGGAGGGPSSGGTNGGSATTARFSLVGRPRLKSALRSGFGLRLTGAAPGKYTIKALEGSRTVGKAGVRVRKAGRATIRLRFSKAAARRLRAKRQVTLTITGAGAASTITLRR